MKCKRSVLFSLLALVMAVVMAAVNPLGVMAEDNNAEKYISDMRIGYGDEGKAKLEAAGYILWKDTKGNLLNANDTAVGSDVWIGYKTTSNRDEAITDLATMNMDGKYSFDDYQALLKDMQAKVTNLLDGFLDAAKEVAANYKNGSAYASTAVELLSHYKEDDTQKTIADLLKEGVGFNDTTGKSVWNRILLEGNADSTTVIEYALALGCTETAGNTFLTRLKDVKYNAENLEPNLAKARTQLLEEIPNLQNQLLNAEMEYEIYEQYEDYETYFQEEEIPENEQPDSIQMVELYKACVNTVYGDLSLDGENPATLFDVMMLPITPTGNEVYLDYYKIDMLARAMTPGQRGLTVLVGLSTFINNAAAVEIPDAVNPTDPNATVKDKETGKYLTKLSEINGLLKSFDETFSDISVYAGVDRSLFENSDDVAMTSAAMDASRKYRDISWGQDNSKSWREDETTRKAMLGMTVVCGVIGIGCIVSAAVLSAMTVPTFDVLTVWKVLNPESMGGGFSTAFSEVQAEAFFRSFYGAEGNTAWSDVVTETTQSSLISNGTTAAYPFLSKVVAIVGVVAMIVACVFMVLTLVTWLYKPSTAEPNYSKIPRALVDVITDEETQEKTLRNYYAVKRIDADENSDNSLLIYGDLNALNSEVDTQWLCLYYSKDPALGNPLTPDILITRGNEGISPEESLTYAPIHMFQDVGAANLNGYSLTHRSDPDADPDVIRVYVKRSQQVVTPEPEPAKPDTGSLFSAGNIAVGVIGLIVGAGIASGISYIIFKRGKKAKQVA